MMSLRLSYFEPQAYPKSLNIGLAGTGQAGVPINQTLTIKNYEKSCGYQILTGTTRPLRQTTENGLRAASPAGILLPH